MEPILESLYSNTTITGIISLISSNPKLLLAVLIQVGLGFGLGYVMAKMAKYVLAFIGILIIGSMLSVWSLGSSLEDILSNTQSKLSELLPLVKKFLLTLGLLTVGPTSLGFVMGLIVGLLKK